MEQKNILKRILISAMVFMMIISFMSVAGLSAAENAYAETTAIKTSLNGVLGTDETGVTTTDFRFYEDEWDMCNVLGNTFYEGNALEANVNDKKAELYGSWKYLSAFIEMPKTVSITDVTAEWYYGSTYNPSGEGYTEFDPPEEWNEEYTGGWYTPSTDTNILACFNIEPDTSNAGTYYYYVVLSYNDGNHIYTLSSISSQAKVVVNTENPIPITPSEISVYFTLEGFGSLPGINRHFVSISQGTTVMDLAKEQLQNYGYSGTWTASMGGYLSGISKNGINYSEFTAGPNSGWLYRVNGEAPAYGMDSYVLQNNDDVVLYYTGDYSKDPYAVKPMKGGYISTVTSNTDSKETEDQTAVSNNENLITGVKKTTVKASSRLVTTKSGKKGVKITWSKSKGYKVDYYQIYRSTRKTKDFKKMFTTKSGSTKSYTNTKNVKIENTYYYKVRGVRTIDGKKYYTEWSDVKKQTVS